MKKQACASGNIEKDCNASCKGTLFDSKTARKLFKQNYSAPGSRETSLSNDIVYQPFVPTLNKSH